MLCLDFVDTMQLGQSMDVELDDLIFRLFALLTAKFEDGASLAANGQGRDHDSQAAKLLADGIQGIAEEIAIVADAIGALIECRSR